MLLAVSMPQEVTNEKATTLQSEETEVISVAEEPVAAEVEVPDATYPVTVVDTGLDFQHTYDGELQVYPDKTVIKATWRSRCGDIAPVDYQSQRFTYTLPSNSSQMAIRNEYSDCFESEGVLTESNPFQIDPDGTIRVDLIEPSDGSLIMEDSIVITGGPVPETEADAESEQVYVEPAPEPEPAYESEPYDTGELGGSGLSDLAQYSTCAEFNSAGLGNFTPDHPSYTSSRDRDQDGIACEF